MNRNLSEEDIKCVLSRAEEIHLEGLGTSNRDDVIVAAEEAGLPRSAVERALREKLDHFVDPPEIGELVYARSSDDHLYVARVLEVSEDQAKVQFLKGGERKSPIGDLRPCSFFPGEKTSVHWPVWGWWDVTVLNYDADEKKVRVDDGWGTEEWFPLSEFRLETSKPKRKRVTAFLYHLAMIAGSASAGALITWLVMR